MGTLELPDRFVCLDTEYTTWEDARDRHWNGPGQYREIVQIGAIIVEGDTLSEVASFECLVRPIKNPILSKYFTDLTGITQEAVDAKGIAYLDALTRLREFTGTLPLYSWGMDLEIMLFNAKLAGIPFPFGLEQKRDVRSVFELEGIATITYQSSTIPQEFGEEPPVSAHSGLSDARSILQGLQGLRRRLSASHGKA